jgi:hypothetical protein
MRGEGERIPGGIETESAIVNMTVGEAMIVMKDLRATETGEETVHRRPRILPLHHHRRRLSTTRHWRRLLCSCY